MNKFQNWFIKQNRLVQYSIATFIAIILSPLIVPIALILIPFAALFWIAVLFELAFNITGGKIDSKLLRWLFADEKIEE